jgi:thioredoxin-related protein
MKSTRNYISIGLFLLITAYVVFIVRGGADDKAKINWLTLEEAQELSAKDPKKIFVDVYTDWCGYCKKMDKETYRDTSVVNYINKNYYAVKLNAESTKKITYKGKKLTYEDIAFNVYNVKVYPTTVLLDSNYGNAMSAEGYLGVEDVKAFLKSFEKR